jgi:hypothetical protein
VEESCRCPFEESVPAFIWGNNEKYPDSLQAGRSGNPIPVGAIFSIPVQTGPGAHTASYTMGTGSFPGVKRPRRGVNHPPLSSAEVKQTVELYLNSPSVPSRHIRQDSRYPRRNSRREPPELKLCHLADLLGITVMYTALLYAEPNHRAHIATEYQTAFYLNSH